MNEPKFPVELFTFEPLTTEEKEQLLDLIIETFEQKRRNGEEETFMLALKFFPQLEAQLRR